MRPWPSTLGFSAGRLDTANTLAFTSASAGEWCVVDDGDEEIIELRSGIPWREHLAQASSSSSSSAATTAAAVAAAATATTTTAAAAAATTIATATVQNHPRIAHASHTLPLAFTPPQPSCAQTPGTSIEAEKGLFGHHLGSRYDRPSDTDTDNIILLRSLERSWLLGWNLHGSVTWRIGLRNRF